MTNDASKPVEFAWSRAFLEVKVCPVAMEAEFCVLIRDKKSQQIIFRGSLDEANAMAEDVARMVSGTIELLVNTALTFGAMPAELKSPSQGKVT